MDFSVSISASPHQTKTLAIAVGVFAEGVLSVAADAIDRAGHGAVRAVIKAEFSARAGTTLVLRNLAGVASARVVLVGLGKQADYNPRVHARAEQAFAAYCVQAHLTEATSTLAAIDCPNTSVRDRARARVARGRVEASH